MNYTTHSQSSATYPDYNASPLIRDNVVALNILKE